jgi:hypothetical protein
VSVAEITIRRKKRYFQEKFWFCREFAPSTALPALCGQKQTHPTRPQDKLETPSCASGNICMRWKRVAVRALYFFRRNHCYAREVPQFLAFMPKILESIAIIA